MNSGLQKCNNYIMFYFKCVREYSAKKKKISVRELVCLTDRLHGSNSVEFFLETYKDSYLGFKEVILNHKLRID